LPNKSGCQAALPLLAFRQVPTKQVLEATPALILGLPLVVGFILSAAYVHESPNHCAQNSSMARVAGATLQF